MMVPIKQEYYEYRFDPDELRKIRTKLSLSQAKLAEMLDVPPNTLSRWETGATAPDAHRLAAIYSIGRKKGFTAEFFKTHGEHRIKKQKTKMLLAWDFQNLGLDAGDVEEEWEYINKYLNRFHPDSRAYRILRAYSSPNQHSATEILRNLKFDVREGFFDADSQLIRDSREECESSPNKWEFVLIADDGDYEQMLRDMQAAGVVAYLWGSDQCSERIQNVLPQENFVNWNAPYVIEICMDVIRGLKGKPISRARFGSLCKNALEPEECYPDEVGFSRRNPYGSLLRWLERRGVISVTEETGKSDAISIVVQDKS